MGWDRKELFSKPLSKDAFKNGKNGSRGYNHGSARKNGTPNDRPWSWQRFALRPGREKRKHLITGGAGFIGSHLSEYLLAQDEEVFIIDDLSTGAIENIDHLKKHSNFHYVINSIANESILAELVDRCDIIYHMAAAVGVKLIVEEPVSTIETNIYGTEAVIRHAAKKKKRMILASTSEVYGKNTKLPFSEDDLMVFGPSTRNRWAYACSKAIDEFLALAYFEEYNLPVSILRFFNTVGPRQVGTYGMVVPRFVRAALCNQPLKVHDDGQQTRCFSYVGDIVKTVAKIALTPHTVGEVFNVGSDEEITIADLAERVVALTGSESPIVYVPYEEAYGKNFEDMRRRVPDLSKIREAIGYEPTHNLNMILRKIITYESERLRIKTAQPVKEVKTIVNH